MGDKMVEIDTKVVDTNTNVTEMKTILESIKK